MTAHSPVRLQFRRLGNRGVLTLKPHQKQTYRSLSRSLVHRQTWRLTGYMMKEVIPVHLKAQKYVTITMIFYLQCSED